MRILAIETATEGCSVALFEDGVLLATRHEVLGRGHAERLVPLIAELPGKGRAEEIRVSLGPGSFTGTRIGIAAARALGVAWGAQVRGYPTLSLVAAMARLSAGNQTVRVAMTGGHGEFFVQDFAADGAASGPHRSLSPEAAAALPGTILVAGSRAANLAALSGSDALALLPEARHALLVPDNQLADALAPLYGRPPDARIPER